MKVEERILRHVRVRINCRMAIAVDIQRSLSPCSVDVAKSEVVVEEEEQSSIRLRLTG